MSPRLIFIWNRGVGVAYLCEHECVYMYAVGFCCLPRFFFYETVSLLSKTPAERQRDVEPAHYQCKVVSGMNSEPYEMVCLTLNQQTY